jgi:hypothetical protein
MNPAGRKLEPIREVFAAFISGSRAESLMDKQSSLGRSEEWRKQWLSGQPLCRSSIGAASRGDALLTGDAVAKRDER